MGVNLVALLWGLAEATLFFIVPDVWTSAAGIDNLKRGLLACLWALLGALIGGTLMYLWGESDPAGSMSWVERVPAISVAMMDRVQAALEDLGVGAVFIGPLQGIPYKTYAVQAHSAGISLTLFLLISIPARLIRFVLVTVLAHVVARHALPGRSPAFKYTVLLLVWAGFYSVYFLVMDN